MLLDMHSGSDMRLDFLILRWDKGGITHLSGKFRTRL